MRTLGADAFGLASSQPTTTVLRLTQLTRKLLGRAVSSTRHPPFHSKSLVCAGTLEYLSDGTPELLDERVTLGSWADRKQVQTDLPGE
jgi:hypothetical protein